MTALDNYRLSDRYTAHHGRVFLSGVQALTRLPLEQLWADRAQGRETAAFISGYQGSPLGGFDLEMRRAMGEVPDLPITLQPALNEEMGATAVMGSQLVASQDDQIYDGVVGYWYGKSPGLDRASDAMRHAVFAGTSAEGGAVALVGDDPQAKSSTLPTSSDVILVGLLMPVLYPGDVQEVLDLGRHAVAMSRITGMWASLKVVTAVADGTGTVEVGVDRVQPVIPDLTIDSNPFTPRPRGTLIAPYTLEMEQELRGTRLELARRYGAANDLNHTPVDPNDAWIGLAAAGLTYHETREALRRLGFETDEQLAGAGIRLLHLKLPYPLDRNVIRRFARGLEEIVVIEEKGPTLERLMKDALYGAPNPPRIVGKHDPEGRHLMADYGQLDADKIVSGLRARLAPRLEAKLTPPKPARSSVSIPVAAARKPYFCSGCPHNWGTKVTEGALVGAGIGCHGMALLMNPERVGDVAGITAMGGEGAEWIGMAPFLQRSHFVQNLGDGTFFHSGQLAIQAAIASGVNMTYKLLYNGTVAMTGGQVVEGGLGVEQIIQVLSAQGVRRLLVTTDQPKRYRGVKLANGSDGVPTEVWDRSRILEAQQVLAATAGVTVLIHDQACAAQNRRLRKRDQVETPSYRVAINHRICEACGDCGDVSNCLSVVSVDTPLGPKTSIDQASCNLDFSCLLGDCPSFMTIEQAPDTRLRQAVRSTLARVPRGLRARGSEKDELPRPELKVSDQSISIRLAGIGGTGVVTTAQILGTAGMLDGFHVRGLDQTGLAQKAGPVISDLRMSRHSTPNSNLVGRGEADLILGLDLLVAASAAVIDTSDPERTIMVASTTETQTGEMIGQPDLNSIDSGQLQRHVTPSVHRGWSHFVDAAALTRAHQGDPSTANVFLLGVAYQAGALPVSLASIESAIELNGVAVVANLDSFRLGRTWVLGLEHHGPESPVRGGADSSLGVSIGPLAPSLKERIDRLGLDDCLRGHIEMLGADLVGYQDEAYAAAWLDLVEVVAWAERATGIDGAELTEAVARGAHKLMAYKDEYEVARLLVGDEGAMAAEQVGGVGAKVHWRLHPPMLRAIGLNSKVSIPATAGRPIMRLLARGKRLRGTRWDPFRWAEVRRVERDLVEAYRMAIVNQLSGLNAENYGEALALARLAEQVRGYEDLKLKRALPVLGQLKAKGDAG